VDGELEWRRCLDALSVAVRDGGHVTAGIGDWAA
jgi:hypothetical protein